MRNKNLFTHTLVIILIFMLIILAAISCQIAEPGGKDISETAKAEKVSGANGKQQEEESENVEEEITAINLWISDLIPGYISTEVRNELSKVFDEIIIVDSKEDSDVWVEIDTSYKDSAVTWILVPVVSFLGILMIYHMRI
jgi:hypothetical protein